MSSSSSRSSKTLTKSAGMSSWKPCTKALNCSSTRFWIRHSVISLGKKLATAIQQHCKAAVTYSTYSFLFSFVTSMFLPSSLRSTMTFSPNRSSSTEKVE